MRGLAIVVLALALLAASAPACKVKDGGEKSKPSGTPTDPVEVCEQHAQVCKMSSSQLGVCLTPKDGSADPRCGESFPCLVCAPQH